MTRVYYTKTKKEDIWGRELVYTVTRGEFNELCEGTFNPQKVIDYINANYGLLGTVTELHMED